VPNYTDKSSVERMIEQCALSAAVLRPAYLIQNDIRQKDGLLEHGIDGMAIRAKGIPVVDVRDIGDAAARELLCRERAGKLLPIEIYQPIFWIIGNVRFRFPVTRTLAVRS